MRCVLLLVILVSSASAEPKVGPVPDGLRKDWKLSAFYKKWINADGLPILSSDKVSDFALIETKYLVDQMLAGRDDVRRAIVKHKVRLAIMAPTEFTLDIPEHSDLKPAAYWNKRARGLGATSVRPAVSAGEENVLELKGDPYAAESIVVHEFAHVVHQQGLADVDPKFQKRLEVLYSEAKREGLWKNTYAMENPAEYWAEAVQSWFHCNRTNDRQHNHVNTRADLEKHDPRMAKLLAESFPKNDWVYVKPTKRPEAGHLKGFDRATAPKFEWPAQMVKDYEEHEAKRKKKEQP